MANVKISQLGDATTPLAGTESIEIVQSGVNKKVAVSEITLGVNTIGFSVGFENSIKPIAGAVVVVLPPVPITVGAALAGLVYYASVGPASEVVVSLEKNGAEFGTITIAIGATSAAVLSGTETSFNGTTDRLSVVYPSTQDTIWAGPVFSIKGTRG